MAKTAFILAGGGSRGAYEIGVWRALGELGERIDLVAGTSVGALNGAMVAQGSQELAEQLWRELETSRVFDIQLDETLPPKQKLASAMRLFGLAAVVQGGAGTNALAGILAQYLNEQQVRESSIDFGLVTVEMNGLRPVRIWKDDIPIGRMNDYLLASSSLFPAIRPHEINGRKYIDGGIYDNLPIEMAMERGADRLIVVDLEAIGVVRRPKDFGDRELIWIDSYWNLGSILFFDPNSARQNMRLGYLDAMRAFGVFDGRAFAFVRGTLQDVVRQYFGNFFEDIGLLGFESVRRRLLDSVAYAAVKKRVFRRGVKANSAVRGFALAGIECAGEAFGLEVGVIYRLELFHQQLAQRLAQVRLPALLTGEVSLRPDNLVSSLGDLLGLVERPARVKFLAGLIRDSLHRRESLPLLPVAALLPDEFCAAFYLAVTGIA